MSLLCGKNNVKSLFLSPDHDFANQTHFGNFSLRKKFFYKVDFASGWAEKSGKFWCSGCSGVIGGRRERKTAEGRQLPNGKCGRKIDSEG